jgi:hypothetical protein
MQLLGESDQNNCFASFFKLFLRHEKCYWRATFLGSPSILVIDEFEKVLKKRLRK